MRKTTDQSMPALSQAVRLGVLDVGSNTAHLQVVDVYPGGSPDPLHSVKAQIGLSEDIDRHGVISPEGMERLVRAVRRCVAEAEAYGVAELVPFGTSSVRDAPNRTEACKQIRRATGVDMAFFSGEAEAGLTFLAARRWYGWQVGRMLMLDIGGGTVELAAGRGEEPELAVSLPLGAWRLTRRYLSQDPPTAQEVKKLRRRLREVLTPTIAAFREQPDPQRVVAVSKIFTQLAKLTSGPEAGEPLALEYRELRRWIPKLARMPAAERAQLPGISAARARNIVAGAVLARTLMELLDVPRVEICPWGIREGILLRHLDDSGGTAANGESGE
ncbi:Ppx/GppA family phosphatase [Crossiella sp. SN42]|uniref:Ppx/GppA phosphatase family protein n=1 Tax=Crossiella sp. SN42 TaxID=2944808 RepID=UPI00207C6829|nr:Ppx/GppA phosphatase family protein [Crossiella sp. SN42]MCO1582307.1 Ppx/GppA family phosphatase [Crossiella sp. SN42]